MQRRRSNAACGADSLGSVPQKPVFVLMLRLTLVLAPLTTPRLALDSVCHASSLRVAVQPAPPRKNILLIAVIGDTTVFLVRAIHATLRGYS